MKTRRKFMAAVALAAAATPLGALLNPASAAEKKVQLMFVQSAESIKADAKTLHLVNVAPQTFYFSDRPERIAGHISMPDYLKEWTAASDPNKISKDPVSYTHHPRKLG